MPVQFAKDVANPDEPQGRVAVRLRDIVNRSQIRSSSELKRLTNYAGSTLSEAMGGRKRQNRSVISGIVGACIKDSAAAQAEIDALVAIIEQSPKSSDSNTAEVVERPPDSDGGESGAVDTGGRDEDNVPLDDEADHDSLGGTTPPATPGESISSETGADSSTRTRPSNEGPGRGAKLKTAVQRRPRLSALLVVLLVLAVTVGGYLGYRATSGCRGEVAMVQGECVGLSDGSAPILVDEPPALTALRQQIHDENQKVSASSQPYVSVAYVFPWAADDDPEVTDRLPVPALQHELEGALVALREANNTEVFGKGPQVRLLLGNEGRAATQYQHVVDDLTGKLGSDPNGPGNSEHIVAAITTGKSVSNALTSIDKITGLGLPVLTTRMTSDEIAPNSGTRSVTRIAPNISDGVQALTGFVHPSALSAIVVQSSDGADNYSRSLGQAFNADFAGKIGSTFAYDPHATTQDMSTVVNNVCNSNRSASDVTVFFAGRSSELNAFVEALPGRSSCVTTHFTIVTGSDAIDTANAALAGQEKNALNLGLRANADLYYAGVASPEQWSPAYAAPGTSAPLLATDFPEQFPEADLRDGAAIIGADAVQTVVSTVRFQPVTSAAGPANNTPARIAQVLKERTGIYAVPLASGSLSLGPTGKAVNKAVPVIRVVPPNATQPAGPTPPAGPNLVAVTYSGR